MKNSTKALGNKLSILRYALVQLVSKALVLLSTYIIALSTTNEIFGYVSLLQASLVVAVTIFGFNLQSGFVRYYYKHHVSHVFNVSKPIIITLFVLAIFSSLCLFYIFYQHKFYVWFSLLPLIGFLNGMVLVFSMLSRSNNKFKLYCISELIRPIFLILIAVLFLLYSFNIVLFYSVSLLFSLLLTLLICISKREQLIYNEIDNKEEPLSTAVFLKYTAPLFFVQGMSLINNVSDRYIMTYFLNISDIGEYGKVYLIGSSFGLFLDSLMLLWTPYVMKNKDGSIRANFQKFQLISILICGISVLLVLAAFLIKLPNVSWIHVSDNFVTMTIIILAAFSARGGYQILTPIVSAYDKTSWVAKISLISMLIGLVLNLIMIPTMGSLGAAISTFAAFLSYSIFAIYLIRKLRVVI
ncbi:lipopolysaccharide biosynthesis protein [Acinetobacter oleivorans]|uniref:lipopolysaccharide biosynthesis protein n=1 Tax=Acinetobacter oleivorans TaxID=1148157 RepID=UPI001784C883|nr:polysaccharide biosynthesis C-terminal domain-containing protein [Acinetobacter oleivorans]